MAVEQHAERKRERVVPEQFVGSGVAGEVHGNEAGLLGVLPREVVNAG
ncbi:hypothetical protein [Microbacterium lacticum]|nr:hypothetical protein [Microbacterium lacticum]